MAMTIIKGITWGHSRGITPLLAASQRFNELHPSIQIQWEKRTLQQFADMPVEELTNSYDLLVIDHPWAGCAAATGCVLPLDKYLPVSYLEDQLANSVGGSHESYNYDGHQWALAIDAATPAASYRPDLLEKLRVKLPASWDELLELAGKGLVAIPAIPIDLLMNFYMFCLANGREPFISADEVIDEATGLLALTSMKELYSQVDKKMFDCNPIAVAELMSKTDEYVYCPFAYCYSNYSRDGYAKHLLAYTDLVPFSNGVKLSSTIGGTGIAVSSFTRHRGAAIAFAKMVVSPKFQATFYLQHGGQPGHGAAWRNKNANHLTHQFFENVLPVMERGYIRPRYNGYLHFQDHAGQPLQEFLRGKEKAETVLEKMNVLYSQSLQIGKSKLVYG